MEASAVVPTRDRPVALRRCLGSLQQQGLDLEVIVVDDGSSDAVAVHEIATAFGARLVRLDGRGPAAARNAGVAAASGEFVLLLDDDCVALPGWAAALVAAAGSADGRVVAGAVSVPSGSGAWVRASELLAAHAESATGFLRTINLCCARQVLLRIPFDERFQAAAGEDRDWCVRAARSGVTFERVAHAGVEHGVELVGRTFLAQQMRYGRAVRGLRALGTHVRMPVSASLRGVNAGFADGPRVGLAMVAAHAAATAGYLAESVRPAAR